MKQIDITADAMVFSRDGDHVQLLLVQRKEDPFKGMWAFPGGFINYNETPEAAAIRELHEETGVKVKSMKQLHTFGKPGRDPRGHTISIVHYTFADAAKTPPTAGDDAATARWTTVKEINELAFDHMDILAYAMKTLELGPFRDRGGIE